MSRCTNAKKHSSGKTNLRIIYPMKIKVVVHNAEEGGYWAEVPTIPGCATQGETLEELLQNLREAINGCLESLK